MKNQISYIETEKRRYPICFNLNVMEEIQEEYGSMSKWGDIVENKEGGEPMMKDLKKGLMAMINEAIDMQNEDREEKAEFVTSKQVGRIIGEVGFNKITSIIKDVSVNATKTGESEKNT